MQVFELADELGARSIDVIDAAELAGIQIRDAGSEIDEAQADQIRSAHRDQMAAAVTQAAQVREPVSVEAPTSGPAAWDSEVDWNTLAPTPPAPETRQPQPELYNPNAPMHPLIRKSIWQFVAAHVVPCIGIYFFFAAYVSAGKGRRQVAWYRGKWRGDTAGQVIQILFWVELAMGGIAFLAYLALFALGTTEPPPQP